MWPTHSQSLCSTLGGGVWLVIMALLVCAWLYVGMTSDEVCECGDGDEGRL